MELRHRYTITSMNKLHPFEGFMATMLPRSVKLAQLTIAGVACWVGRNTQAQERSLAWYGCFEFKDQQVISVGGSRTAVIHQLRKLIREARQQ